MNQPLPIPSTAAGLHTFSRELPTSRAPAGSHPSDDTSHAVHALVDTLTLDDVEVDTNDHDSDASSLDEQPVAGVGHLFHSKITMK